MTCRTLGFELDRGFEVLTDALSLLGDQGQTQRCNGKLGEKTYAEDVATSGLDGILGFVETQSTSQNLLRYVGSRVLNRFGGFRSGRGCLRCQLHEHTEELTGS